MSFFGRWLSFHDAEVLTYDSAEDSISLTLHAWLMTDEMDAEGYFVLQNHALVSFRFDGLQEVRMDAFRSGNILFGIEITSCADSALFQVDLNSVMDMSGSFSARSGEIVSVIPCTSDGRVAATSGRCQGLPPWRV